jgi:ADP-ribose pyrophosphatase YjhB (NUDIX family)
MKVRIITTARALILNEENDLLLVKNEDSNSWFTPGGWLDGFETLEETLKREVFEETGLVVMPIKLCKIDYYMLKAEDNIKWKENINKIEHYFLCNIVEGRIKSDKNHKNLWEDKDKGNTQYIRFFTEKERFSNNLKEEIVPAWLRYFKRINLVNPL